MTRDEQARAIAAAFVDKLRELLTGEEWAEMRRRNWHADPHVCHSHDYVDANLPMAEAFAEVMGRPADVESGEDCQLWSWAWDAAMPALGGRSTR